jgi:hypothetical protein
MCQVSRAISHVTVAFRCPQPFFFFLQFAICNLVIFGPTLVNDGAQCKAQLRTL